MYTCTRYEHKSFCTDLRTLRQTNVSSLLTAAGVESPEGELGREEEGEVEDSDEPLRESISASS